MERLLEIGGEICNEFKDGEYSIIIDAVFGVGLSRKVEGKYFDILEKMNRAGGVKFAVDMPSGISADTLPNLTELSRTVSVAPWGWVSVPTRYLCGSNSVLCS